MDKNVRTYYKNKIKILCVDARVKYVDKDKFEYLLKKQLKDVLSDMAYDICIKRAKVDSVSENLIILSVSTTDILKLNTDGKYEQTVINLLTKMMDESDIQAFNK